MFSIVTPTRNAADRLKRCVGSVRRQTEVLTEHLVQDCVSTDGTVEWLTGQSDIDWRSEPDEGMYDAISRAWARSRGDILSWLNADEQYLGGTLDRVQKVFDAHPDVDAVYGDYIIADADTGQAFAARREIPLRRRYVVNGVLYSASCTLFFRRRLLDGGLLRLDTGLRAVADARLVVSLLDRGVRFLHVPSYLSVFGASGANMSTGENALKEAAESRCAMGAYRWTWLRRLVLLARRAEKAWNGCYKALPLQYEFCVDETGRTKQISVLRVETRWRFE